MHGGMDGLRHGLRYLDMDRDLDLRCQVEGGRRELAGLLEFTTRGFACDKLGFDEGVRVRT